MQHDGGRLAFQETTDRIIQALGIRTGKQAGLHPPATSPHSPGWACETMRLFLRALRSFALGFQGLLGREDEATHYEDARTGEARCPGPLPASGPVPSTAAQLEEYRLLERPAGAVPCGQTPTGARGTDDDAGECKVPVALKDPKRCPPTRCNRPNGPTAATRGRGTRRRWRRPATRRTQLITHVEVTPSSGSDTA